MIGHIIKGWFFWQKVRIKYAVNYNKAMIVLTNDNHELDKQILFHLPDFAKRKHVNKTVVVCRERYVAEWALLFADDSVEIHAMTESDMEKLYSYYCFIKFFDNIVFTYVDKPADNLLGTYLRETDVNEEDAACLALYHLRFVPEARRN